ncbi:MAG: hypothetical protein H7Y20_01700 [Bryobacteraceae bacterium]|nr:hypothetical protein [Bryobacteraceae bacterium]
MSSFFPSGYPEDADAVQVQDGIVKKVTVRAGNKVRVGLRDGTWLNASVKHYFDGPWKSALRPAVKIRESHLAQVVDLPGPWASGTRMLEISALTEGSTVLETGAAQDATVEVLILPNHPRVGPRLGRDGTIPSGLEPVVRRAIEIVWRLDDDHNFTEAFRDTVGKLSGAKLGSDAYSNALNVTVINLAEDSKDPRVIAFLTEDAESVKKDPAYSSPPALSFPKQPNIWIRRFSLQKGERAVAANIIHECSHVAGAPGNQLAEIALDVIHNAAGLPR